MRKILICIAAAFAFAALMSCDSTYTEPTAQEDEILSLPKADCSGNLCF